MKYNAHVKHRSCISACIMAFFFFFFIFMALAFYINRYCTVNFLEYFNPPVLLKLFWNSKIIKLATLEYFILKVMAKRDFRDFKFYNLVQSDKKH